MSKIYIGTSGWMYKDWGREFYPPDMKKGHLSFLAQEFRTVEVNSSFYHLPLKSTFRKWRDETPDTFVFAVKLSRYITHRKKLSGVRLSLEKFIKRSKGMGDKLGTILVQLPPYLRFNEKLLQKFLLDVDTVSRRNNFNARFALEPRHKSWMEAAPLVRSLVREHNIAIVFPHSSKIPSFPPTDENIVADFVYIRMHGPSEFAASRYGPALLEPWAERIALWHKKKLDVFFYFNNDVHGHAVHDARTLIDLVNRKRTSYGVYPYSGRVAA